MGKVQDDSSSLFLLLRNIMDCLQRTAQVVFPGNKM